MRKLPVEEVKKKPQSSSIVSHEGSLVFRNKKWINDRIPFECLVSCTGIDDTDRERGRDLLHKSVKRLTTICNSSLHNCPITVSSGKAKKNPVEKQRKRTRMYAETHETKGGNKRESETINKQTHSGTGKREKEMFLLLLKQDE